MTDDPDRYFSLTANLRICRLVNGLWQVAGAHGTINPRLALEDMFDYGDAGFTTFDVADHYGPAEDLLGEFLSQWRASGADRQGIPIQALTKWVPRPDLMSRRVVESHVDRARRRLNVDCLDLLQFHWWDYRDRRYQDALRHLTDLKGAGKIRHLGLTNFDTQHLSELLNRGIPLVSNQVQFSIIDRRPLDLMVPYCQTQEISLLAYGTLAGGLLSSQFLGQPEPLNHQLTTASLRKYKRMVDAWGRWELFQKLLFVLQEIAQNHGVSLANVAVAWVLAQPTVAGAIVGCRLGLAQHRQDNDRIFSLRLTEEEFQHIEQVATEGNNLLRLVGDCGNEYR